MGLFNWAAQDQCGEDSSTPCDPLPYKEGGRALMATDKVSRCPIELKATEFPSIPVILGAETVEARSGSIAQPIDFSKVQTHKGIAGVPELFFRNAAGQFAAWRPEASDSCLQKKVVFKDGVFQIKADVNSNVFEEACIGDIADVDYVAGAKEFTDCAGNTRVKLIFFPLDQLPSGS